MGEPMNQPDDMPPENVAEPTIPSPPSGLPPQRLLQADDLFGNSKEVLIQNGNDIYRLRRTRSGKLILCK